MRTLYFLNELRRLDTLGHVDVFANINLMIRGVEAIDVMNNEYSAFSSDGNWIQLRADFEYSPVKYEIENFQGSELLIVKLLSEFLAKIVSRTRHAIEPEKIALASSIGELAELVPELIVIDE